MDFMTVSLNDATGKFETWVGAKPDGVPWEPLIQAAEENPNVLAMFRLERVA